MQSRRREDYSSPSPVSKSRSHHRLSRVSDPHNGSRRHTLDRSPRTGQSRSPNRLDGSRLGLGASRRSRSTERREYAWHAGGGSGARSDRMRSKSPPLEQVQRRAPMDEGGIAMHRDYGLPLELRQRYELSEHNDFKVADDSLKSKNAYRYQNSSYRIGKDIDFSDGRLSTGGGHGMLAQRSLVEDDGLARGSYRFPQDLGPSSSYVQTRGHLSSSSQTLDIRQFEQERVQYRDPIAVDTLPIMHSCKDERKPLFEQMDAAYPIGSTSHPKGFVSTSPLKDLAGPSSRMLRDEFLGSYLDGSQLSHSDGFARSNGKLIDPISFNTYRQSPILHSAGDHEAGQRNLTYCQRGAYSPTRVKFEDYPYPTLGETANDNCGYPSDDLYRRMPSHVPLDYDNAKVENDHGALPRSSLMQHVINRVDDNTEDPYGNRERLILLDHHPTLQKQSVPDYLDMNRTSNTSNQVMQDYEISHLGTSQDHQISHLSSDYGFGKDAGPKFLKERLQSPPVSVYETDMHRHSLRMHRVEDPGLYEPSNRVLKRKYTVVEELAGHDSRKLMSKHNVQGEHQDLYNNGEEWIDEDRSAIFLPDAVGFDRNEYRKSRRIHDRLEYQQDFVTDDRLSLEGSFPHRQRHSLLYKQGGRYTRDHPKAGSLSSQDLRYFDRRSVPHKQPKVWKRNDDYQDEVDAGYDDSMEDWVGPSESEPAEDSEKFKQKVHEAFLEYSKKLSMNSSVQRRYKERGKAGSLFCIVCGRSLSKEFMDTQRLVTHAFMSHKAGLRARHLGLHKAICVLLGWSTAVPHDTITWVPQVLPRADALAQKEDLILWPPVIIIHNSSMLDNNPEKWEVVTIDEIEAFLRRKGFVRGRIKVCLGSPADKSVMVVKFLGTFTGLGDAERFHKYLAENKHGRVDFERLISNNAKSSSRSDARMEGGKLEERILYGYMGIAEDFDKVDFSTRKSNLVKSKKEIQELANAPLRPDDG